MYGIARYFKADERRRALELFREAQTRGELLCPLGALLRVHTGRHNRDGKPTASEVANCLKPSWQIGAWLEIEALAARFADDYDDGKIRDVARALGAERTEGSKGAPSPDPSA